MVKKGCWADMLNDKVMMFTGIASIVISLAIVILMFLRDQGVL